MIEIKLMKSIHIFLAAQIAFVSSAFHIVPTRLSSTWSSTTSLKMDGGNNLIAGVVALSLLGSMIYASGSEERERKSQYTKWKEESKAIQADIARKAFIQPKPFWKEVELKQYDGTQDEEGPILFAADGKVFNVYKGRNFYGPGGEYHLFAGRDATRLLARGKLEEETEEEKSKPLTMAERAALQGWIWTFKGKYDIVGELEGFDPKSTSTKIL